MRALGVGVGEMRTSNRPGEVLRSYALGSCIGLVVLSPNQRAVGMVHVALPDSKINLQLAKELPGMFADTGIPFLLEAMSQYGCRVPGDLIVKMAGGANILDPGSTFEIGKRNILAVKKTLWRYRLGPVAEDVGDFFSRTLSVDVDAGMVVLSSPQRGEWQI
jgi:chemotaxis protein CheD